MIASPGSVTLALLVGVGGLLGTGALASALGFAVSCAATWCGL